MKTYLLKIYWQCAMHAPNNPIIKLVIPSMPGIYIRQSEEAFNQIASDLSMRSAAV